MFECGMGNTVSIRPSSLSAPWHAFRHAPAAVDGQHLSGDIARGVGEEENRSFIEIARHADPPAIERLFLTDEGANRLVANGPLRHWRCHQRWRNRVEADVLWRVMRGGRSCESEYRSRRRRISVRGKVDRRW